MSSSPSPSGASSAGMLGRNSRPVRTLSSSASASAVRHPLLRTQRAALLAELVGARVVVGPSWPVPTCRESAFPSARKSSALLTLARQATSASNTASTSDASTPRRASAALTASRSSRNARISIICTHGSLRRRACRRGHRTHRALRTDWNGPRRRRPRPDGRLRRGARRARPERRRQDVHGRDAGGLSPPVRRDRPGARSRPAGRPCRAHRPRRRHAPAWRRLSDAGSTPRPRPLCGVLPGPGAVERICWSWSGCVAWPAPPFATSRAANNSDSPSRSRSSAVPRSRSSTSRPPASTPKAASPSAPSWRTSRRRVSVSYSRPTSSARRRGWRIASSYFREGGSVSRARPRR